MTNGDNIEYIKDNMDVKVDNAIWSYIAIQQLLNEVERLRKALEEIKSHTFSAVVKNGVSCYDIAREALDK